MREGDLDIVELIINNMPEENELQVRIKLYVKCNHFFTINIIHANA